MLYETINLIVIFWFYHSCQCQFISNSFSDMFEFVVNSTSQKNATKRSLQTTSAFRFLKEDYGL